MTKTDIASLNFTQLSQTISAMGLPKFRTQQIYDWIHKKGAVSFDEMTNLSKDLRTQLYDNFVIFSCAIEKKLVSCYDNTVKYLFRLHDGEFIESVVMQYKYGYTICVSSQVGCNMGCAFCASTIGGRVRSLSASEILGQVYAAQRDLGIRISHVVMMGMGEPLDNYEQTLQFLHMISDEKGLNISARNISVSTCGIVPRIYDLADERLGVTLSISLHAADDERRSRLMPVNKRWPIRQLLQAVRYYIDHTGRRVSFEYTLVRGENDSAEDARRLCALLKGMLCHVNLIPVNEVRETGMKTVDQSAVRDFQAILLKHGVNATIRRTLGADINASCGQLRKSNIKTP